MRFELDYLDEYRVSRVTLSGVMRLREYQAMVQSVLAEMADRETTRLVVDLRNVTLSLSFAETSSLPDTNLALGVPMHYQVAVIFLEYSVKATGVRLYEIIAGNRGYDHKLFTCYPSAFQWLHKEEQKGGSCSGMLDRNVALHGLGSKLPVMGDQENGTGILRNRFQQ
ncbi:hypothetical protein LG198_07675 [Methylobacillus arboreus]|uniref:hypothetical protein n=1 Tax=Methylobacillus arboreus TaxID=755170 RepID=UPI001E62181F|nr:hypothetical protein [Methylobacillus arboreus]MCB5190601.1 hypothetical protein [Methylobacillus arboreus]